MKKLLILMLVLGLTSTVNATLTLELREADGITPVAGDLLVTTDYTAVIGGETADKGVTGGLYGPTFTAADWSIVGPADSTVTKVDTGDMSFLNWYAPYQGYELLADDTGTGGPGVSTGDWFIVDLTGLAEGIFSLDLYDYRVSDAVPVATTGPVNVIPEPMTIALLGLGGLFLRRRK